MSKGPWKNAPADRTATAKALAKAQAEAAERLKDLNINLPDSESKPAASVEPDALAKFTQTVEHLVQVQAQQAEMLRLMQHSFLQRTERAEARDVARSDMRAQARPREPEGVKDRDGNVLVRRSFESMDPFELPYEFIAEAQAENYTLEWKSEYVYNQQRSSYIAKLMDNGKWKPVLNSRLPGRYPGDPDEPIRHDGMLLMERPAGLTQQARREDLIKAHEQVTMRQRNWGVSSKRPDYFDPHTAEAEKFTLLRKTLEVADSAWQPELQIALDSDL